MTLPQKNGLREFLKNNKKSDSEGYIQNIQKKKVLEGAAWDFEFF